MSKKNKSTLKSACCKAKLKYSSPAPDFIGEKEPTIGTCYCVCSKCDKPCNIVLDERKKWTINPSTRIKKDEREKLKSKQNRLELND